METIESLLNEIEGEVLRAKKAAFSSTDIVLTILEIPDEFFLKIS